MNTIISVFFILASLLAWSADENFQTVQVLTNDFGVFALRVSYTNKAAYQRVQVRAEAQIKEWEAKTNVLTLPPEMKPWEVNYVNVYEVVQILPQTTNIIYRTYYVVWKGTEHFRTGYKLLDCYYNTNRMYGTALLNDSNEIMFLVFFRGDIMPKLDTNDKAFCRVPGIPWQPGSVVTKMEVFDEGETALYVRLTRKSATKDIYLFDGSRWRLFEGKILDKFKASGYTLSDEKPPDGK